MSKKTLFFAILLSAASLSFAKNSNSTLTVIPYDTFMWGYLDAEFTINQTLHLVGKKITLPVSPNDVFSLTDVKVMEVYPTIDDSCKNIRLNEEGAHQLLFKEEGDWAIHCRYI